MKQIDNIFTKLIIACLLAFCFVSYDTYAQLWDPDKKLQSGDVCGGNKKDCSNDTCQLKKNSSGILPEKCPSGARYDVDPNCVMNKNAEQGSCMDTMPVASIKRVSETNCYRANGAGGNDNPRNHLGTDYSAGAGTYVTAAADGKVVFAKYMTDGGRTIIIEHEKKCQCSAGNSNSGCDDKFTSVYMHLLAFAVSEGASVSKGSVIGQVGGSNYKNGVLCDYNKPEGGCKPYGPHLHFEIHSGSTNGKTGEGARIAYANSLKQSIIDPLCDDIQSFCGGCSYNMKDDCTGKTNTNQWTELNDDAKKDKSVVNPPANFSTETTGTTDPVAAAQTSHGCDYTKFMPNDSDTCYFCPLFKVLFNAGSRLALKTYQNLADAIANVVLVAFALWVSVFVLRHISALEVQKPSKMIQEFLVMAFKVMLVVIILKISYFQVLRLTIAPVFNTGMAYVQTISESKGCSSSAPYMQNLKGFESEIDKNMTGALPLSVGRNVLCSIKSMQDSVYKMIAYGKQIRCIGWRIKAFIPFVLPNFAYVITGDVLILAGFILLLAFPWCLVDCVLNMAIASALIPAAIGAWPFKWTKKYLNKIWEFFMNAMFQFVFLSIILYIIMTVVSELFKSIESYSTDYNKIINPITGLAFWGVNCLKLVMACLLGYVFLDQAKDIAGKFAKAPDLRIGKSTGGFFAQAADRAILGAKDKDGKRHGGALGAVKTVGAPAARLGKLAVQAKIGQPLRKKINERRGNFVKKHGEEIRDDSGKLLGYRLKRKILGQEITQTAMIGANGQLMYSAERKGVANWLRKGANNARLNMIQNKDQLLLNQMNKADQDSIETSDDGKISTLRDIKGNLVAQKKILDDGKIEITSKHGVSVYENGKLVSATRNYRNLLGEKVEMHINGQMQNKEIGHVQLHFVDNDGKALKGGNLRIDEHSNLVNQHNQIIGQVRDGKIYKDGKKIGNVKQFLTNQTGQIIGKMSQSGFIDNEGKSLGNVSIKDGKAFISEPVSYNLDRQVYSHRMSAVNKLGKAVGSEKIQNFANTYKVKHDRDLSANLGTTTSITKNQLFHIVETKDSSGQPVEQNISWKTPLADFVIRRDGKLDVDLYNQLQTDTNTPKDLFNQAIALKAIESRGLPLPSKFESREITHQDGATIISQKNRDGTETRIAVQIAQSGQIVTTTQRLDTKGNVRSITTDNGMISRTITQNEKGEDVADYRFNDRLYQKYSYHNFIDKDGKFYDLLDEGEMMLGFDERDRELLARQEITGRRQSYNLNHEERDRLHDVRHHEEERHRMEGVRREEERTQQREASEHGHQAEEERQRQEAERQRQTEEERQRQEAERQRQAEEERQRQEAERQRQAEEERQRQTAKQQEEEDRQRQATQQQLDEEARQRPENEQKPQTGEEKQEADKEENQKPVTENTTDKEDDSGEADQISPDK